MNKPTHTNPVREARKRRGLSQLALALRAGLSLNTVSLAERSGRMTDDVASRLAEALGVEVAVLLGSKGAR